MMKARCMIRASRLHDVQRFLDAYGYKNFEAHGYLIEEAPLEFWTVHRIGFGLIGSVQLDCSGGEKTPRNVSMMLISAIEKWRKKLNENSES